MPAPPHSGVLIAIEGIDGAGKTTQVRLLLEALLRDGRSVIASKEPTSGRWGAILRQSAFTGRLSLAEELQTFINDRTEHVETLIRPHLDSGGVVILDRYFYSTIAYQGARGASVDAVTREMWDLFPIPDAVFILDIDPAQGIHRISTGRGEQPNHFEDHRNLAAARAIFNAMKGENIHTLDAAQPIARIHGQIRDKLAEGPLKPPIRENSR